MAAAYRALESKLDHVLNKQQLLDDDCFLVRRPITFSFSVWDQSHNEAIIGNVGTDMTIHFVQANGTPRTIGGQVVNEKAKGASEAEVIQLLHRLNKEPIIKASVFYDGDFCLDRDTPLHVRFDCEKQLRVANVLTASNPLVLIDEF